MRRQSQTALRSEECDSAHQQRQECHSAFCQMGYDMALLTHQLSNYLGVWHGARACEAEGLGVDVFASMLPPDDPAAHLAWRIHNGDYDNPGATLEVWNAALDRIIQHADTAKINREVPELVSSLFRRAIALGHGNRDIATVIEVLRAG